jgi:hypothetical protein
MLEDFAKYETANRHYAHVDCPGHADYIKNMITGAAQMDGDGIYAWGVLLDITRVRWDPIIIRDDGVLLAFSPVRGVPPMDDEELLELIKLEVRELLNHYGLPGDACPGTGNPSSACPGTDNRSSDCPDKWPLPWEVGITLGATPGGTIPITTSSSVTRAQMAAFLARALGLHFPSY